MSARLVHGVILAVAATALALVVILAHQNRNLRTQMTDLRLRQVTPQAGSFVPALRAETVHGEALQIAAGADMDRQVLFVFRTTCQFCEASLPAMQQLAEVLGARGIRLIGLALDSVHTARDYSRSRRLPYPVATFPDARSRGLYRAGYTPATLVVGGDGRVLHARLGVLSDSAAVDSIFVAATAGPTGGE